MVYDQAPPRWDVRDAAFRVPLGSVPQRDLTDTLARDLNRTAQRLAIEECPNERLARPIRMVRSMLGRTPLYLAASRALLDDTKCRLYPSQTWPDPGDSYPSSLTLMQAIRGAAQRLAPGGIDGHRHTQRRLAGPAQVATEEIEHRRRGLLAGSLRQRDTWPERTSSGSRLASRGPAASGRT